MQPHIRSLTAFCISSLVATSLGVLPGARASSHMDAPLITLDDAANTTDVYAFVTERDGVKYLTTALAVFPFEEPGIGPNAYRFDDDVRYEIHVVTGDDLTKGAPTFTFRFEFETTFPNPDTILQAFEDVVMVDELAEDPRLSFPGANLTQTYVVTKVDRSGRRVRRTVLGSGVVPPNNQGNVTPFYNQGNFGENPAKEGVDSFEDLDPYTQRAIQPLDGGYLAFAGQRDDGFFADIQAVFDGLTFRSGADSFDSQGGFNVHTMVLDIPVAEIGGDQQIAGVFATTSRQRARLLRTQGDPRTRGRFVQVGRQGNPLFAEGFIAIADKDTYNRTLPTKDLELFSRYALNPELADLVNTNLFGGALVALPEERTDLAAIFAPDVIRVDLSTGPARLAGQRGFSRLGIFGTDPETGEPDVLISTIREGFGGGAVPGGWPNGRRFGDDVVDIAVIALLSDLRDPDNLVINTAGDGIDNVSSNDITYNDTFPYAATPLNGRRHDHH